MMVIDPEAKRRCVENGTGIGHANASAEREIAVRGESEHAGFMLARAAESVVAPVHASGSPETEFASSGVVLGVSWTIHPHQWRQPCYVHVRHSCLLVPMNISACSPHHTLTKANCRSTSTPHGQKLRPWIERPEDLRVAEAASSHLAGDLYDVDVEVVHAGPTVSAVANVELSSTELDPVFSSPVVDVAEPIRNVLLGSRELQMRIPASGNDGCRESARYLEAPNCAHATNNLVIHPSWKLKAGFRVRTALGRQRGIRKNASPGIGHLHSQITELRHHWGTDYRSI